MAGGRDAPPGDLRPGHPENALHRPRHPGARPGAALRALPLATAAILLATGGEALAHRPHDVVVALAPHPYFAVNGRAWLVLDPSSLSQLMLSRDRGRHWSAFASPASNDVLVDLDYSGASLVALAEDGTLWVSHDEGRNWSQSQLPTGALGRDMVPMLSAVLVAGDSGVYRGEPSDAPSMYRVLAEPVSRVVTSPSDPGEVLALADDGGVWRSDDFGWSYSFVADLPGGEAGIAAALVWGRVVVGTVSGALWWDETALEWVPCGPLPAHEEGDYAESVAYLSSDFWGGLYAGSGVEAGFHSDDLCETWDIHHSPFHVHWGGAGAPEEPEGAVSFIRELDGRLIAAGWSGAHVSDDGGETWLGSKLISGDYVRGVTATGGWPSDPRIYVTGYGGGAYFTDDGGNTWDGSAVGLNGQMTYLQDIRPAPGHAASGVVWASADRQPYRSDDRGATWSFADLGFGTLHTLHDVAGALWLAGQPAGVPGNLILRSLDDGDTFEEMTSLQAAMSGGVVSVAAGTLAGTDVLLVATRDPATLLVSDDDGLSWSSAWTGDAGGEVRGLIWPSAGGRLLVVDADGEGVVFSDDGGDTWVAAAESPEGPIRDAVMADDGTAFAATADGQLWRSTDGGNRWVRRGARIAPAVFDLECARDFAATGTLLIGTYAGVYSSTDGGNTIQKLRRYERFENGSYHLICTDFETGGACDRWTDPTRGNNGGHILTNGDTLEFTFEGSAFQVLGPTEVEGSISVVVDGAFWGDVVAGAVPMRVSGLATGWHDVVLTADSAPGELLHFDAIEVFGPGRPMAVP